MTAWMWPPPVEIPERHRRKAMDDAASSYGRVLKPGQLDTSHGVVLYLDNICVSFDGFKALNKLSLDIAVGEMRCIIGPNGAGKTTLFEMLAGSVQPDTGSVAYHPALEVVGTIPTETGAPPFVTAMLRKTNQPSMSNFVAITGK